VVDSAAGSRSGSGGSGSGSFSSPPPPTDGGRSAATDRPEPGASQDQPQTAPDNLAVVNDDGPAAAAEADPPPVAEVNPVEDQQQEEIIAFLPGIDLPVVVTTDTQVSDAAAPADAVANTDDTLAASLLSDDDRQDLARQPRPITLNPASVANLEAVLASLDRIRTRPPEPPGVPQPRALVGPGGVIETTVARVAAAVAGPAAASIPVSRATPAPATRPAPAPRSSPLPPPRISGAVPPALQTLRVRVGQPDTPDMRPVQATLRVRVEPDTSSRLMAVNGTRTVSADVLTLGLLAAGVVGIGLFGRAAREGRRRLGPRHS
jgi:hypothetical protein